MDRLRYQLTRLLPSCNLILTKSNIIEEWDSNIRVDVDCTLTMGGLLATTLILTATNSSATISLAQGFLIPEEMAVAKVRRIRDFIKEHPFRPQCKKIKKKLANPATEEEIKTLMKIFSGVDDLSDLDPEEYEISRYEVIKFVEDGIIPIGINKNLFGKLLKQVMKKKPPLEEDEPQ